jgi:hypothetical protein
MALGVTSIVTTLRSGKFTSEVSPERGAYFKKCDTCEVAGVVLAIGANSTVCATIRGTA